MLKLMVSFLLLGTFQFAYAGDAADSYCSIHYKKSTFSYKVCYKTHRIVSISKEHIKTTSKAALEFFAFEIHPQFQKAYKWYYNKYGLKISSYLLQKYDKTKPLLDQRLKIVYEYWYARYPELFDDINYIPTPLKIIQEKFVFAVWGLLYKTKEFQKQHLEADYQEIVNMALKAHKVYTGKVKINSEDQKRLNRLLDDLRASSPDKQMASCFKVFPVEDRIENAFNTGCNIFIFKALIENLNDKQLRSVIAHEMAHGANGDGLKNLAYMVSIFAKFSGHLIMEEMLWFLTNEEGEHFNAVINKQGIKTLLEDFSKTAPAVELRADIMGVQILNASGFSGEDMIETLYIIHGVAPGEEDMHEANYESVRDYPSLHKRIQAVKSAMIF